MTRTAPKLFWKLWPLLAVLMAALPLRAQEQAVPALKTPAKPPVVPVEKYRADLQKAADTLKSMEEKPPRKIGGILQQLSKAVEVRRGDGQTQTLDGYQWKRWGDDTDNSQPWNGTVPPSSPNAPVTVAPAQQNVSIDDVKKLRQAVEKRIEALDAWSNASYTSEDAQSIINQLEGSGQIRTGPTALQQWIFNMNKWVKDLFMKIVNWLSSMAPSAKPGTLPTIDPTWVEIFFYATVFALLGLVAYLTWRALGGRMIKRKGKRGVFAEGEDAELLLLPPDELRQRAAAFAREGNFREALRHLYIALLLGLDAGGVWRYDARKTNWEHIAALRANQTHTTLVPPLSNITRTFDRVRYGDAPFEAHDWQRFEQEVNGVESRPQAP